MLKRHKDFLRAVVTELRHVLAGYADGSGTWLRGDLDREMERLGISPGGTAIPLDSLPNPTDAERRARYVADAQFASLQNSERIAARTELVERAAYSWINRLLALRVMEARGLIDETLRCNPDYGGVSEALYLLRSQSPDRAVGADGGWWAVVEDACAAQAATLPGLFDLRDPTVALRPSTPALLRCVAVAGNILPGYTIEEADAAFADPDAIGWAYQFYQEEAKARTYAKFGSGGKAETRSEIASATQLFTERYMVQWLLQNSLGRSYHEVYPDTKLPDTWDYYVRHPSDEEVKASLSVKSLSELTVMDPCMGSGHFLREAFDMLAAMYREREPGLSAAEIADRILTHHLHGVDIDPRAAQLAALTLYLRAWELVREEQLTRRRVGPTAYQPPTMNLATTPTGLSAGALERHLRRHPEDLVFKPLLEGIFAALEKADLLGSLLQPGAQLDAAIAKLQRPYTMAMDFDADQAELQRTLTELAGNDPVKLKRMLLDRIAASFAGEVGSSDVGADLFGREAEQGVRLLELLDRRYAAVVTNPPYMGSGNMGNPLRRHVEQQYPQGKADLYAAFMLRCLGFCSSQGRLAMVTQQTWISLVSFSALRSAPTDKPRRGSKNTGFPGVLLATCIEAMAHLGRYAFSEIGNAAVAPLMFVLRSAAPSPEHRIWACRLVAPRPSEEQAAILSQATRTSSVVGPSMDLPNPHPGDQLVARPKQLQFLSIPNAPICYWLRDRFLEMFLARASFGTIAEIRHGLSTCDNPRFTRCFWEARIGQEGWSLLAKAGTYRKWIGLEQWVVDWRHGGARIKQSIAAKFPYLKGNVGLVIGSEEFYFRRGWTYSTVCRGSLGVRQLSSTTIASHASYGVFPAGDGPEAILLNSHLSSYLLRGLTSKPSFEGGQVASLPLLSRDGQLPSVPLPVDLFLELKGHLISRDPTEWGFDIDTRGITDSEVNRISTLLHTLEGYAEALVFHALDLKADDTKAVIAETGTPAGWYPLIAGYDKWPLGTFLTDRCEILAMIGDYLAKQERVTFDRAGLSAIVAQLRSFYASGPAASDSPAEDTADESTGPSDEEDAPTSGARIPIPSETFLEELSTRLKIHPVSVYWLLEELRAQGARCKPGERRLLEDRLSVLILRLLGHRWPKQIQAGEPVPDWAGCGGIIPLTPWGGESTAAERLRERLRTEGGDLGAQRSEALLQELTGLTLEDWVRREFFPRHVRQFKYRPIAWHLASAPQGGHGKRKGVRRQPAFECLVYYHACAGDVLARIRSQYLQPLTLVEQRRAEDARAVGDETAAALAMERIVELEAFAAKLRQVDEEGFACPELDELVAVEPLDRWSSDGRQEPPNHEELLRRERAWHVDLNDGVRVNIAPLQLAGVLAAEVLKAADARKAIADRASWRADERRWVREGKLPRCGWMGDDVPESSRWRELAPQREAERRKLEEKRGAASERLL